MRARQQSDSAGAFMESCRLRPVVACSITSILNSAHTSPKMAFARRRTVAGIFSAPPNKFTNRSSALVRMTGQSNARCTTGPAISLALSSIVAFAVGFDAASPPTAPTAAPAAAPAMLPAKVPAAAVAAECAFLAARATVGAALWTAASALPCSAFILVQYLTPPEGKLPGTVPVPRTCRYNIV